MRCPKCRCEVGARRICPYCGSTVYIHDSSVNFEYSVNTPIGGGYNSFQNKDVASDLVQRILRIETKLNLILILSVATFVLAILALIIAALN